MNRGARFYIAVGAFITLLGGTLVYGITSYLKSLAPDYLSFTYLQPIKQEPAIFHLDGAIPVEALFYNSNDRPIDFTALVFWSLVGGNRQILQFSFQQTLKPGCTELSFNNYPPDQVIQVTEDLFSKGQDEVKWRIEGHNAVTKPYSGGLQPFRVQDATYIPDDQSLPKTEIKDRLQC